MNKKEEIDESIEFCRDIYTYYKKGQGGTDEADSQPSAVFPPDAAHGYYTNKENRSRKSEFLQTGRAEEESPSLLRAAGRNLLSIFFCIVVSFCIAKLLNVYLVQQTKVEGTSMEDTLHDGDRLFIDKVSYRFRDPRRFEIVVFPFEDNIYYIKRIIGLPGETVSIQEGAVLIDGVPLEEEYGKQLIEYDGLAAAGVTLGKEEYFVMGDNRNDSLDSRYEVVGNVKRDSFMGRAVFRIYPFQDFGGLR